MEAWLSRRGGLDAVEPEIAEIERINESVDYRVLLVDPVVKVLRQQCRLRTICSLDEPLHDHALRIIRGIIEGEVFSHSQGQDRTSTPPTQMYAHSSRLHSGQALFISGDWLSQPLKRVAATRISSPPRRTKRCRCRAPSLGAGFEMYPLADRPTMTGRPEGDKITLALETGRLPGYPRNIG